MSPEDRGNGVIKNEREKMTIINHWSGTIHINNKTPEEFYVYNRNKYKNQNSIGVQ